MPVRRRLWLAGALAVLVIAAAVAGLVLAGGNDGSKQVATAPPRTTTSSTTSTTTTTVALDTTATLRQGMTGPQVAALQRKLIDLGYWIDVVDGMYATESVHAVTAFQKSASLKPDGVASPATLARLASATRLAPRSTTGRAIEVDLKRQILLVVRDGRVEWVMDTSTGTRSRPTPTGLFQVTSEVDRDEAGPLGVLHRPKYFADGLAVHGADTIPATPATQGTVRVTIAAMDWIWANGAMPIGTPVWVY